MGTFKGLQILLAIKQLTKTSYLPARERDFGLRFPVVFLAELPDFLAAGFPLLFGFDFEEPLVRFS